MRPRAVWRGRRTEESAFPVAEFVRIRRAPEGPEVSRLRLRPVGNPASSARGSRPCPLAAIAAGLGLLLAGCHRAVEQAAAPDGAAGTPGVARTEVERGPVRVTLELAPHPARLSDEPTLTLTVEYQRGVQVRKPPFGEALGDFQVRDFREPLPEIQGDREILRQVYKLEPTRAGQLKIDPIAIAFTDARANGDGREHTLETEALAVEVTSLVGDQVPQLDQLRGLTGPLELPAPSRGDGWWLVGLTAAAGLAGAAGLAVWRRRRQAAAVPALSPQELAYLELQQLLDQDLSRRDVKQFYVELTGIVRRYIERTTGIHAPEQTTEEFLREINAGRVFPPQERGRLAAFLESADLVKFAAFEPAAGDVAETFERAKAFLGLDAQEVAA